MSAFGYYEKDDIVDCIKTLVDYLKETKPEIQVNEIVKEVLEAVTVGIGRAVWDIENE